MDTAYTILEQDTGERFSTTDYECLHSAMRERNRLALRYGKEFALAVCRCTLGGLEEVDEDDCCACTNCREECEAREDRNTEGETI